jgi:hypothetical protein
MARHPASRPAGALAATLLLAAAVVALASVVAYWGWRWLGPAPFTPGSPVVDAPVERLALYPPFGAGTGGDRAEAPVAAGLGSDARLLGVLAERDGGGRALFRMPDGTPRLVEAGSALDRETTLAAVRPDGVTLRDAAGERTILLRQPRAEPARPAGTARTQRTASAACAIPAGYKGPIVRINAELVQGLISQPEGLRAIAEARDGALVIRDETGFAALVGMRKGDRVTQANGIALRAPEDVIIAVLRPLAASQVVRLSGMRGSEPRELYIVNAGTCPG